MQGLKPEREGNEGEAIGNVEFFREMPREDNDDDKNEDQNEKDEPS